MLTRKHNLEGLARLNVQGVDGAMTHTPHRRVILDMDSSESPVHGEQEGAAYNGHFGCVCLGQPFSVVGVLVAGQTALHRLPEQGHHLVLDVATAPALLQTGSRRLRQSRASSNSRHARSPASDVIVAPWLLSGLLSNASLPSDSLPQNVALDWSGWPGSNRRPPGPKPGALPLRYTPTRWGKKTSQPQDPRRSGNSGQFRLDHTERSPTAPDAWCAIRWRPRRRGPGGTGWSRRTACL